MGSNEIEEGLIESGCWPEQPVVVGVTVADALALVFAWLVAVTVTGCVKLAGAVYSPEAETPPTLGLIVQFTAWLLLLATVAVNCWVYPAHSEALVGLTETAIGGIKLTVADALGLGLTVLVAVTVTACWVVTVAGAVYIPEGEMLPTVGWVQVTVWVGVLATAAVNCWVFPPYSVALTGLTLTDTGAPCVT
jgi:hypothetical protein